ncbi:MAG: PilZ domain-containing protein [Treponema sp.]|nr:PilZ domain-containing protein [Treponema sp.]
MDEQLGHGEGKKIFLLRPHSVIHEEMLNILIMAGYETYTLTDLEKARKLLAKFPGSIMFINIDEGLQESEWENYIRKIQEDNATKDCRLGIMSYNQDKTLMQKYLMDISIPCGYIQLKLGLQESTKIILNALEANEARGRRRSIRADCHDDLSSTMNYKGVSGMYHGNILDISSMGIAARMDKVDDLPANSMLRQVQVRLRGGLFITDMIFVGKRRDSRDEFILLFDPKMSNENRAVINRYVKQCLQKYIDNLKI